MTRRYWGTMRDHKVKIRIYLNKVKEANRQILHIEEDIEILRDGLDSIKATDYSNEVVQTSGVQDRIAHKVAEIMDLEADMLLQKYELIKKRSAVGMVINRLESPHRDVLRHRYLDDLSFEEIADLMGYEQHYVYNLHQDGINQLAEMHEVVEGLLI